MASRAAATLTLLSVLCVCSPADPAPVLHKCFQRCRSSSYEASLTALEVLPGGGSPADPDPVRRPVGWFQKCRSSSSTDASLTALEVLPGGGWDNLRNLDMGRVMNFSYERCQTTEDGSYFVPDDVFAVPWKVTDVDIYAEVIASWLDHKSSTSASINVGGSGTLEEFGELNGKFSAEYQRVKTNQVNDDSSTTRVQVRNIIYTVKANPDFRLDSLFVRQVENIAAAIKNNQADLATYLSEKLVADYGTHVITSVDAGATLVKEDYVKSSSVSSSDSSMTSIKASAAYSFFGLFSIDMQSSLNHDSSEQSKYTSSITNSFIMGYGGSPYYPDMSLKEWQDSTRNNLVAVDRSGVPLHSAINANTLPRLTEPTVSQVAVSVQQAVEQYYRVNAHRGCVDYNSPHFSFAANVNDDSCNPNHSLGGFFRTVHEYWPVNSIYSKQYTLKNPETGDYTCREPYQKILLNAFSHPLGPGVWSNVTTYWCYSSAPTENRGFFFGGFYLNNSVTNDKICPFFFTPFRFLDADGGGALYICLSSEYTLAAGRALPFGGIFSCFSANPFTGRRDCPPLFSQKLLSQGKGGCPIHYCVKSGQFRGEQPLTARLPPKSGRFRGEQPLTARLPPFAARP